MIRSRMSAFLVSVWVVGSLAALVPAPAEAVAPAAPSGRWGMGMAYDAAHGQVVLFGGVIPGFPRYLPRPSDWVPIQTKLMKATQAVAAGYYFSLAIDARA